MKIIICLFLIGNGAFAFAKPSPSAIAECKNLKSVKEQKECIHKEVCKERAKGKKHSANCK